MNCVYTQTIYLYFRILCLYLTMVDNGWSLSWGSVFSSSFSIPSFFHLLSILCLINFPAVYRLCTPSHFDVFGILTAQCESCTVVFCYFVSQLTQFVVMFGCGFWSFFGGALMCAVVVTSAFCWLKLDYILLLRDSFRLLHFCANWMFNCD